MSAMPRKRPTTISAPHVATGQGQSLAMHKKRPDPRQRICITLQNLEPRSHAAASWGTLVGEPARWSVLLTWGVDAQSSMRVTAKRRSFGR
jgi:hypothetical protein